MKNDKFQRTSPKTFGKKFGKTTSSVTSNGSSRRPSKASGEDFSNNKKALDKAPLDMRQLRSAPALKYLEEQPPRTSFGEMNLSTPLETALKVMGIKRPTDIQARAIPSIAMGSDIIAVSQTGSGKTLAYALSVLTQLEKKQDSRALVLAPSREMAQQIHKVFEQLCAELPISVCLVIGGLSNSEQISILKKHPRLIVATPGRMNDHLLNNKLLLQKVEVVVIDEADRMLDMGFAPQLKSIKSTLRGHQQILMFSATFGPVVETVAKILMKEEVIMIRGNNAEKPVQTLNQKVVWIDEKNKNDYLVDVLKKSKGSVLIFTDSQEACQSLGQHLKNNGFEAQLVHGGLTQGHRTRLSREFRERQFRILVGTDLLARGVDISHIELIVNFDLPMKAEDFLHRIGRTARAGRSGQALTFITKADREKYEKIKPYLVGAQEIRLQS